MSSPACVLRYTVPVIGKSSPLGMICVSSGVRLAHRARGPLAARQDHGRAQGVGMESTVL